MAFRVFILFYLVSTLYAEENKITLRINGGISASFHDKRRLSILKGSASKFPQGSFFSRSLIKKRTKRPTFERFYDFADSIFDFKFDKKHIFEELEELFYDPDAKLWEGLCDKWSASSIDYNVISISNNYNNGMLCGDQLFSYGEIKEILSFIYPFDPILRGSIAEFVGVQTKVSEKRNVLFGGLKSKALNLPQFSISIRNGLGVDDLNPNEFRNFLYSKLVNRQGIIVDLNHNHKVQNFPVNGADFEKIKLLRPSGKHLKFLIPEIFRTSDSEIKEIIDFISKSDNSLERFIGPYSSLNEKNQNYLKWKNINDDIMPEFINMLYQNKILAKINFDSRCDFSRENFITMPSCFEDINIGYIQIRSILLKYLYNYSLTNSEIGLVPDLEIFINKITLYVNRPGHPFKIFFGLNYDLNEDIEDAIDLEYISFESGNNIIESRWVTRADKRPDFAWTPNLITTSPYPWQKILLQMFYNSEFLFGKCININQMLDLVNRCNANKEFIPEELFNFRRKYENFKNFFNSGTKNFLENCLFRN